MRRGGYYERANQLTSADPVDRKFADTPVRLPSAPAGEPGRGVWLLKNTDDVFLGPVDFTGVSSSCEAQKADGAITGVSDTSTIDDVSGVYLGGHLVPPGGFFWARKGANGWFAVSGGLSLFKGTINGDGEVVYTPANLDYSEFPVQLTGTVCAEDDFVEDQVVLVGFDGTATYVIRDCCPPDPPDP